MQYRLRFFAIFLSMIVDNSKNGVIFAVSSVMKIGTRPQGCCTA